MLQLFTAFNLNLDKNRIKEERESNDCVVCVGVCVTLET